LQEFDIPSPCRLVRGNEIAVTSEGRDRERGGLQFHAPGRNAPLFCHDLSEQRLPQLDRTQAKPSHERYQALRFIRRINDLEGHHSHARPHG